MPFPLPADAYFEGYIDLNRQLVKHPMATFYVRVSGDSMTGAGIHRDSILVVDRAVEAEDGDIVVARINNELTVRRLRVRHGRIWLMPENEKYKPIEVIEGMDFEVWGRVLHAIISYGHSVPVEGEATSFGERNLKVDQHRGATSQLAIVFIDVANSTALMSEAGDLAAGKVVRECLDRADLLMPAYEGKVIKLVGDSLLAVFDKVANALTFAIEFNVSLIKEPILLLERKLMVRTSIHYGNVHLAQTSYGNEAYGQVITLAARLLSLAEPGEVIISKDARLSLPEDRQYTLGSIENHKVKGIDGEVEISRINVKGA